MTSDGKPDNFILMIIIFILIPVFIIALLIGGIVWYRRRIITVTPEAKTPRIPFRWRYIMLPLVIIALTIIISLVFYTRLPVQVAWHFAADGIPDRWLDRTVVVIIGIGIQSLLALIAWGLVLGASRSIISYQNALQELKGSGLLPVLGNMVALPQIIACFVMTDIFSYNIYQIHLLPTWLFIIITLVVATIVFVMFFLMMVKRANTQTDE